MPAMLKFQHLDRPARVVGDQIDLRHAAVLVAITLDREERALDRWQKALDVPIAKLRRKPHVVPAVKGLGRVAMMAREFLRQIGGLECSLGGGDAIDADALHE